MSEQIIQYLKTNILCRLNIHNWNISRLVNRNGNLINHVRTCEDCDKEQRLGRPIKYHPTKYIWVDSKKIKL